MEDARECQSDSKFHMPSQNCFYKRKIPFIGYLQGHENPCDCSNKECYRKNCVPEFSMKLE